MSFLRFPAGTRISRKWTLSAQALMLLLVSLTLISATTISSFSGYEGRDFVEGTTVSVFFDVPTGEPLCPSGTKCTQEQVHELFEFHYLELPPHEGWWENSTHFIIRVKYPTLNTNSSIYPFSNPPVYFRADVDTSNIDFYDYSDAYFMKTRYMAGFSTESYAIYDSTTVKPIKMSTTPGGGFEIDVNPIPGVQLSYHYGEHFAEGDLYNLYNVNEDSYRLKAKGETFLNTGVSTELVMYLDYSYTFHAHLWPRTSNNYGTPLIPLSDPFLAKGMYRPNVGVSYIDILPDHFSNPIRCNSSCPKFQLAENHAPLSPAPFVEAIHAVPGGDAVTFYFSDETNMHNLPANSVITGTNFVQVGVDGCIGGHWEYLGPDTLILTCPTQTGFIAHSCPPRAACKRSNTGCSTVYDATNTRTAIPYNPADVCSSPRVIEAAPDSSVLVRTYSSSSTWQKGSRLYFHFSRYTNRARGHRIIHDKATVDSLFFRSQGASFGVDYEGYWVDGFTYAVRSVDPTDSNIVFVDGPGVGRPLGVVIVSDGSGITPRRYTNTFSFEDDSTDPVAISLDTNSHRVIRYSSRPLRVLRASVALSSDLVSNFASANNTESELFVSQWVSVPGPAVPDGAPAPSFSVFSGNVPRVGSASNDLVLSPADLQFDVSYYFSLEVRLSWDHDVVVARTYALVEMKHSELVLNLQNVGRQVDVADTNDVVVTALLADPDNTADAVSYTWESCVLTLPDNQQRPCFTDGAIISSAAGNSFGVNPSLLDIPSGTEENVGTANITVLAIKGTRQARRSGILSLTRVKVPSVFVRSVVPFNRFVVSKRLSLEAVFDRSYLEDGSETSLVWFSRSPGLDLSSGVSLTATTGSYSLLLRRNTLSLDSVYSIGFNLTVDGITATAAFDFESAPEFVQGNCSCTPSSGQFGVDEFQFSCSGFSDGTTLTYCFYQIVSSSAPVLMYCSASSSFIPSKLPAGVSQTYLATVRSEYGTELSSQFSVDVTLPSTSTEVDALANTEASQISKQVESGSSEAALQAIATANSLMAASTTFATVTTVSNSVIKGLSRLDARADAKSLEEAQSMLTLMGQVGDQSYATSDLLESVTNFQSKQLSDMLLRLEEDGETDFEPKSAVEASMSSLGRAISAKGDDEVHTLQGTYESAILASQKILLQTSVVGQDPVVIDTGDVLLTTQKQTRSSLLSGVTVTPGLHTSRFGGGGGDRRFRMMSSAGESSEVAEIVIPTDLANLPQEIAFSFSHSLKDIYSTVNSTNTTGEVAKNGFEYSDTVSSNLSTSIVSFSLFDAVTGSVLTVSDTASPFLITIPHDSIETSGNASQNYVTFCRFWDPLALQWRGDGCEVVSRSNTSTVCACDHLTDFSVDIRDFQPRYQRLSAQDFRNLTVQNLVRHPITLLTLFLTFIIFGLGLVYARRVDRHHSSKYDYLTKAILRAAKQKQKNESEQSSSRTEISRGASDVRVNMLDSSDSVSHPSHTRGSSASIELQVVGEDEPGYDEYVKQMTINEEALVAVIEAEEEREEREEALENGDDDDNSPPPSRAPVQHRGSFMDAPAALDMDPDAEPTEGVMRVETDADFMTQPSFGRITTDEQRMLAQSVDHTEFSSVVKRTDEEWRKKKTDKIPYWKRNKSIAKFVHIFRHEHLWFSVVFRHPRERVNSVRRLSSILALVVGTMAISAVFYGNQKLLADIGVIIISSIFTLPATWFLIYLWRGGSTDGSLVTKEELAKMKLGLPFKRHGCLGRAGPVLAWFFWFIWVAGCSLLCLVYGLQFDLRNDERDNESGANLYALGAVTLTTRWLLSTALSFAQDIVINRPLIIWFKSFFVKVAPPK